jgi:hypothetical protein
MGDRVTIPRTLAGLIGVADVQDSIRRKQIKVPLMDTTWRFLGNNTTGGIKFPRNVVIERGYLSWHMARTTSHVHKFRLRVFKNGSTMMYSGAVPHNTTANLVGATTGWKANEIVPLTSALASLTSADRITVDVTHHTDATTRTALILEYREDLDA